MRSIPDYLLILKIGIFSQKNDTYLRNIPIFFIISCFRTLIHISARNVWTRRSPPILLFFLSCELNCELWKSHHRFIPTSLRHRLGPSFTQHFKKHVFKVQYVSQKRVKKIDVKLLICQILIYFFWENHLCSNFKIEFACIFCVVFWGGDSVGGWRICSLICAQQHWVMWCWRFILGWSVWFPHVSTCCCLRLKSWSVQSLFACDQSKPRPSSPQLHPLPRRPPRPEWHCRPRYAGEAQNVFSLSHLPSPLYWVTLHAVAPPPAFLQEFAPPPTSGRGPSACSISLAPLITYYCNDKRGVVTAHSLFWKGPNSILKVFRFTKTKKIQGWSDTAAPGRQV